MANLQYCPPVPLSKLDTTGLNAGDHLIFNSGSGEIEGTQDIDSLTIQPMLTANGNAVLNGLTPIDTSTIAITVDAPTGAVAGDRFGIADGTANASAFNITVDFGTINFNGTPGAFTFNCDGRGMIFYYVDVTTGYILHG